MSAKIDIDKLAREARKQNQRQRQLDPNEVIKVVQPSGWNIFIDPLSPKTVSEGGIEIAAESQTVEEVNTSAGYVLAIGPTAMTGVTESGIRIAEILYNIGRPEQLIGKCVVFHKYTGQEIKLRKLGKKIIVMTIPDILAIVHNPDDLQFWI